jgi:hypothetical protein
MFQKVRVINKKRQTLKQGIIVGLTNKGANVYDNQTEPPFTDNALRSEWFPFESNEISIVKR